MHGQSVWLSSNENNQYIDYMSNSIIINNPSEKYINHHPSFKPINESIFHIEGNGMTIFTVTDGRSSEGEELIWKITEENKDLILHTNKRIVNLGQGDFMNFSTKSSNNPQLSTFFNNQNVSGHFHVGSTPNNTDIPVSKLSNGLGEVIIFDKVLSPQSIELIQSTLSLKYSLTLPNNHNYYSLNNELLWDKSESNHNYNMGGLGRLDQLKFNQNTSSTSIDNGRITFSKLNGNTTNNTYLIWGDDNNPLKFEEHNGISVLSRTWAFKATRMEDSMYNLSLEHPGIINNIKTDQQLYAVTKEMSETKISPFVTKNTYVETSLNLVKEEGTIKLVQAPKFWAWVEVDPPNCSDENRGKIEGLVVGGMPPYECQLYKKGDTKIQILVSDNKFKIENLKGGEYELFVKDKNGQEWKTNIQLNHEDIIPPTLHEVISQADLNKEIVPYLNQTPDYNLTWITPTGNTIFENIHKPNEIGQYSLIVNYKDCENKYDFEVLHSLENIKKSTIFPNPSTTGYQYLSASFENPLPYQIKINDLEGRMIYENKFPGSQQLFHEFRLNQGVYIVTLISGTHLVNHKLIVLNQ